MVLSISCGTGQPVAGIISMEMMAVLEEALEDRRMARVAGARLEAIQQGDEDLMDEGEFWAKVDALGAGRAARPGRKAAGG